MRHPRHEAISAAVVAVVVLAGCSSVERPVGNDPSATAPGASVVPTPSTAEHATPSAAPQAEGTAISTAGSEFGEVLWGPDQQVVYIWQSDVSSEPQCYDDCAADWPPVLTEGQPVGNGQVDAVLLGTSERRDGTVQVTYNGHPLYFYAHEGPGEVRCHDVATHGGIWWVITPVGERAP